MSDLMRIMRQAREQWDLNHKWRHLSITEKKKRLKGIRICKDPRCVYNQKSLPNENWGR